MRAAELVRREAAEASWKLAKARSTCEERLIRLYVAEQPRCKARGRRAVRAHQFEIELARAVFEQETCEKFSSVVAKSLRRVEDVQRSGYVLPAYAHRLPKVTPAALKTKRS